MNIKNIRKKIYAMGFALLILCIGAACSKSNEGPKSPEEPEEPSEKALIIATFNMGYDNANATGNEAWANRKDITAELISKHKFDVFGAQEPLYNQLMDMKDLVPEYAYVGVSRTGETNAGEFAPVFYNTETIEVLDSGQFWLTDVEDKSEPSVGWDARYPRTCVWIKAKSKKSNETFFVFNVHLDHIGSQARLESTRLLMDEVPRISGSSPFFLLGDFNFSQLQTNYHTIISSSQFVDTYDIAKRNINGDRGTFNGYNPNSTATTRIDHIFTQKANPPTIKRHQIVTDTFRGLVPSDHFPVLVEVDF